jgi:hypothetical protein
MTVKLGTMEVIEIPRTHKIQIKGNVVHIEHLCAIKGQKQNKRKRVQVRDQAMEEWGRCPKTGWIVIPVCIV